MNMSYFIKVYLVEALQATWFQLVADFPLLIFSDLIDNSRFRFLEEEGEKRTVAKSIESISNAMRIILAPRQIILVGGKGCLQEVYFFRHNTV